MGKDAQVLRRLFYAIWMLSCDWSTSESEGVHLDCKGVYVIHKRVSFYVVYLLLSDNMTVFFIPVMPWCHKHHAVIAL